MDAIETITQPWRNPMEYARLVLWVVIFVVVASIVYDGVRLFATSVKSAVAS